MRYFEDRDGYSQMCFSDEAQDELKMSQKERKAVCSLLFGMGVTPPDSAKTAKTNRGGEHKHSRKHKGESQHVDNRG